MENINWKEKLYVDESIEKIDDHEYCPYSTNLNQAHADIRINIQNQDQFILPHKSYLYVECKLEKADGTDYDKDDNITVVNNPFAFLFERISYEINGKEIEGTSNVGICTTMKGILTYAGSYPEGTLFLWKKDNSKHLKESSFAKLRKTIILQRHKTGHFSGIIPLTHLFGFCENYQKIMYGLQHTLILRRNYDADAILKSQEQEDEVDKVPDGKLIISKLSWYMPHITLSDEAKLSLMKDIRNRSTIDVGFLNRQCERYNIIKGSRELDWRLNMAAGSERPRYIIVGFQQAENQNQKFNNAIFNHFNYKNGYVQLNNERYPEHDLHVDFKMNHIIHPFKMYISFYHDVMGKEESPIGITDFENYYPLLVFDVSHQSEKLKSSPVDIRVKVEFDSAQNEDVTAYALVLSDRFVKLASDGNRMNIVY